MKKMYCLQGVIITLLIFSPLNIMAYSPSFRTPGVVSNNGEFFLTVVPAIYNYDGDEATEETPAKVTVYKVSKTGEPERVWQLEGWYEYTENIYLSFDGKSIVRLRKHWVGSDGSYRSYQEVPDQDLLAIFRESGKVAGYTATELFTDLTKGLQWGGWYPRWFHQNGKNKPALKWKYTTEIDTSDSGNEVSVSMPTSQYFELHTLEGLRYHFDLETGGVLEREFYK